MKTRNDNKNGLSNKIKSLKKMLEKLGKVLKVPRGQYIFCYLPMFLINHEGHKGVK